MTLKIKIKDEYGFTFGFVIASALAIVALVIGVALVVSHHDAKACAAKGGKIVGTGHYNTTVIYTGKSSYISTYETTTCKIPG